MIGKDKQTDMSSTAIKESDIAESIDELESLIAKNGIPSGLPPKLQGEIPVLNDVVDAAEARRYAQAETTSSDSENKIEDFPIEKMNQLVDKVDLKLSSELDSLVDILKATVKDSIIDELKEELKKEAAQMESAPSEIDPSDEPAK
ncbi:MAG: hypothetical protein ACE1ZM_01750 [Gammaproteobacteria bacterium]